MQPDPQRKALEEFASTTVSTAQSIFNDYVHLHKAVSVLQAVVENLEADLQQLDLIIRTGQDGRDGLVTEIRLLRARTEAVETLVHEQQERLARLGLDMESARLLRSTWYLVAQVVAWLIATVIGILGVFL